jgi:putative oxygen-independent coproporphyrinogen III oxidase
MVNVNHSPTSAYIHIPFCRRRCFYCDFPVFVVGDRQEGENSHTIKNYIDFLVQEISITPFGGQPLATVFFGGGTPSLLSVNQLTRILDTLDRRFGIANDAEISIEMDPGTFDLQKLYGYIQAGVNRVSLGIQAFQDELLTVCGRSHNTKDIFTGVDLLNQVGVSDFSIDLISGLPHQTLDQWQESLETAVMISPSHISSYDLIVEPKTPFHRYYQPGVFPLPDDRIAADMYRLAVNILTNAGYQHYEVSNYAFPGSQCRHNRVYWENRPYYGFGMGATSYLENKRFTRPRKTADYYQWVETLIKADGEIDSPETPVDDRLLETIMLGLRLADGLNCDTLIEQFGHETLKQIWHCLQPYHRQGWVELVTAQGIPIILSPGESLPTGSHVKLTDPEGFLFSNTILATLFEKLTD